ncbi:MAG: hypothetical protein ACREWG_09560 [Gammaproteobacteria bacterium]
MDREVPHDGRFKSLYSSAIAFATHAKFGVQDDIISAVVTRDGGKTYELIHAPHYQPFTRLLLGELERESANTKFRLADIAGNEKITLTYRATSGAGTMANAKEIMRDPEITAIVRGKKQYANRITVEADVSKIPAIYRALRAHGVAIDHFYDY